MNFAVVTTAQNTGLDSAVFATQDEAEQAIKASRPIFQQDEFLCIPTDKPVTTTFKEWNNAGW